MIFVLGTIIFLIIVITVVIIIKLDKGCKEDGDCKDNQYCKDKKCIDKCTKESCDKTKQICNETTFKCEDCPGGFDWTNSGCSKTQALVTPPVPSPEQPRVETPPVITIPEQPKVEMVLETSKYDNLIDITDNIVKDDIDETTRILKIPFKNECELDEFKYEINNTTTACICTDSNDGVTCTDQSGNTDTDCVGFGSFDNGGTAVFDDIYPISFATLKDDATITSVINNDNNVGLVYHKRDDDYTGPYRVGFKEGDKLTPTFSGNDTLSVCIKPSYENISGTKCTYNETVNSAYMNSEFCTIDDPKDCKIYDGKVMMPYVIDGDPPPVCKNPTYNYDTSKLSFDIMKEKSTDKIFLRMKDGKDLSLIFDHANDITVCCDK